MEIMPQMNPIGPESGAGQVRPETRAANDSLIGGVRWIGITGDAAGAETGADRAGAKRGSPMIVLGSAHGPRLLELITAC
jgi:hypothetical protein